jgi:benzoate 4-monooxygenase
LTSPDTADRKDLLARLIEGRDGNGNAMGRQELTAEAQTQLIAGSDTTSNTSCALLYYVLSTDGVLAKMQKELDERLGSFGVPEYNNVKDLP